MLHALKQNSTLTAVWQEYNLYSISINRIKGIGHNKVFRRNRTRKTDRTVGIEAVKKYARSQIAIVKTKFVITHDNDFLLLWN